MMGIQNIPSNAESESQYSSKLREIQRHIQREISLNWKTKINFLLEIQILMTGSQLEAPAHRPFPI